MSAERWDVRPDPSAPESGDEVRRRVDRMVCDGTLPTGEIAKEALRIVQLILDEKKGTDWYHTSAARDMRTVLEVAEGRMRMAGQRRDRRPARWLASPTSFTYPRRLSPGDIFEPEEKCARHTHLCFETEITDGSKTATGRKVEVQVPLEKAESFGRQIQSMARICQAQNKKEETA